MKLILAAIALVAAAAVLPAMAADVGVTVSVSQPGVYGRVDIGRFPQPQVFVAQPVVVQAPRYVVQRPDPVYMWVPPGHRKNWRKHCGKYEACGVPVYFVQDQWYERKVKPHRHDVRRDDREDRRDDRGHVRYDDDHHGKKDKGHGKGHGKDKHKDKHKD